MKKYQVFISSTYKDLIPERLAVEEVVMRGGDIPVGMEAFPAVDEEQFEFIKSLILQCDYYILMIADRYGSLAEGGISYTEREFNFAVENGVPVIFLLHGDRSSIKGEFVEKDPKSREKLENFIGRASNGRIRKEFTSIDDLKYKVSTSLSHSKQTKPRPGWVRGGSAEPTELLERILALQDENKNLKSERPKTYDVKNVAGLDHIIALRMTFRYQPRSSSQYRDGHQTVEISLGEIFGLISPNLHRHLNTSDVSTLIAKLVLHKHDPSIETSSERVDGEQIQTLKIQFRALGLTKNNGGLEWLITPEGDAEMMRRRVLVSEDVEREGGS